MIQDNIDYLLRDYDSVTLADMKRVSLMQRTDTKFVTSRKALLRLIRLAQTGYSVQEVAGERASHYCTLYYDTRNLNMYLDHLHGHANRQKVRVRSYMDCGLSFIEVKTKNNHGVTGKQREAFCTFNASSPDYQLRFGTGDCLAADNLIAATLRYDATSLQPVLENHFRRITLVDNAMTERVTKDLDINFYNITTGMVAAIPDIAVIELKRDSRRPSAMLSMLRSLGICRALPSGTSLR